MKTKQKPAVFLVSALPRIEPGDCKKMTVFTVGNNFLIKVYGAKRLPIFKSGTLIEVRRWGDSEWLSLEGGFRNQDKDFYKAKDVPNLSKCISLSGLFVECPKFNQDLSKWDTSNVTDMSWMFAYCINFNQDVSNWNISNVRDMSHMFHGCASFDQDISDWNTSKVEDMSWTFVDCINFNQTLSKWNVSAVKNASHMFHGCVKFDHQAFYSPAR